MAVTILLASLPRNKPTASSALTTPVGAKVRVIREGPGPASGSTSEIIVETSANGTAWDPAGVIAQHPAGPGTSTLTVTSAGRIRAWVVLVKTSTDLVTAEVI